MINFPAGTTTPATITADWLALTARSPKAARGRSASQMDADQPSHRLAGCTLEQVLAIGGASPSSPPARAVLRISADTRTKFALHLRRKHHNAGLAPTRNDCRHDVSNRLDRNELELDSRGPRRHRLRYSDNARDARSDGRLHLHRPARLELLRPHVNLAGRTAMEFPVQPHRATRPARNHLNIAVQRTRDRRNRNPHQRHRLHQGATVFISA